MLDLIKSKLVLYSAAFGAVFSLILGLVSGVHVTTLLVRVLISGIAMGALALGLQVLIKKFIPAEDIDALLGRNKSGDTAGYDDKSVPGRKIDITDDDDMTADEIYQADRFGKVPSDDAEPNYGRAEEEAPISEPGESTFRETDFNEMPRVQASGIETFGDEMDKEIKAEAPTDEKEEMIRGELDRLKEQSRGEPASSPAESRPKGDGSFKVGNTKVNADPKIIAKAIRTVLHRD